MKLDLDALEREAVCLEPWKLAALVAIARAAVAWRDAVNVDGASGKVATVRDLLAALREAGL